MRACEYSLHLCARAQRPFEFLRACSFDKIAMLPPSFSVSACRPSARNPCRAWRSKRKGESTLQLASTRLVPDKTGLRRCRRVSAGLEWSFEFRFILAKSAILAQERRFPAGRNGDSIPPASNRKSLIYNGLRIVKTRVPDEYPMDTAFGGSHPGEAGFRSPRPLDHWRLMKTDRDWSEFLGSATRPGNANPRPTDPKVSGSNPDGDVFHSRSESRFLMS